MCEMLDRPAADPTRTAGDEHVFPGQRARRRGLDLLRDLADRTLGERNVACDVLPQKY